MKEKTRMGATWRKCRILASIGVLLIVCEPAHAFYWQGWPGSQIRPEPSLLGPPKQPNPGTPPPDTDVPQTPIGPTIPVDRPPVGPPTQTPEPATGLLGLLGLSAIVARRWWKKR